jgi:hypothetical protein
LPAQHFLFLLGALFVQIQYSACAVTVVRSGKRRRWPTWMVVTTDICNIELYIIIICPLAMAIYSGLVACLCVPTVRAVSLSCFCSVAQYHNQHRPRHCAPTPPTPPLASFFPRANAMRCPLARVELSSSCRAAPGKRVWLSASFFNHWPWWFPAPPPPPFRSPRGLIALPEASEQPRALTPKRL